MALTNSFHEAVKEGNVRRVRIMMKDSLLVDPTFTDFNNMEKEARDMSGLYDAHDGREFISDASEWNNDYMDTLMVQVVSNFSHERIEHLKNVVEKLRPVAKTASSAQTSTSAASENNAHRLTSGSSYQEQKSRDQQNGDYRGTTIAVGAATGAVVGGVVAAVAGAAAIGVVGGVAAGALAGGVAVTIAVRGGK